MRSVLIFLGGLLIASCDRPKLLMDGCYYAQGKPVLKIAGAEGRVLIPGEVKGFKVERDGGELRFVPGLLFDSDEGHPLLMRAFPDAPPYFMKSGTSVPTIEMHWIAYGDEDVSLGKQC